MEKQISNKYSCLYLSRPYRPTTSIFPSLNILLQPILFSYLSRLVLLDILWRTPLSIALSSDEMSSVEIGSDEVMWHLWCEQSVVGCVCVCAEFRERSWAIWYLATSWIPMNLWMLKSLQSAVWQSGTRTCRSTRCFAAVPALGHCWRATVSAPSRPRQTAVPDPAICTSAADTSLENTDPSKAVRSTPFKSNRPDRFACCPPENATPKLLPAPFMNSSACIMLWKRLPNPGAQRNTTVYVVDSLCSWMSVFCALLYW